MDNLANSVFYEEADFSRGIFFMELGTNNENLTAPNGECTFTEPWIDDPDVFKNIDEA